MCQKNGSGSNPPSPSPCDTGPRGYPSEPYSPPRREPYYPDKFYRADGSYDFFAAIRDERMSFRD